MPANLLEQLHQRPWTMFGALVLASAVTLSGALRAPFCIFDDMVHMQAAFEHGNSTTEMLTAPNPKVSAFPVTLVSWHLDRLLFGDGRKPTDGKAVQTIVQDATGQAKTVLLPQSAGPFNEPVPPPWGMRLLNALYHALAGLALWAFIRNIAGSSGIAALVALAWTIHPMACESVCWVSERKNVLAALFGFSSLWAWSAGREQWWRWPAVYVCFALALWSKPSGMAMLPLLAALEVLDPPAYAFQWRSPRAWLKALVRLAFPIAASLAVVLISVNVYRKELFPPPGGSLWTALLTDTEIFSRYVQNILAPFDLSFFYGVQPIVSLGDWRLWSYTLALLGLFGGAIWAAGRERRALAVFATVWFFGALGPNANIIAILYWMQDRYAYLAAPGLLLLVALALAGLAQRFPNGPRTLQWTGRVFLAVLTVLTVARSTQFANSEKLLFHAVSRQPNSAAGRLAAAAALKQRYHAYSMAGPMPDPELARRTGMALLNVYAGIEDCPDIRNQIDAWSLRVLKAELLPHLGLLRETADTIGPMPPPDGAPPAYVALAWLTLGEANLRLSAQPGLTRPQQLEFSRKAAEQAEQSLQAHRRDYEAYMLKGRALVRLADLFAAQNDMAAAMTHYDEGIGVIKRVPASSLAATAARQFVQNVGPPQPPPPPQPPGKEAKP